MPQALRDHAVSHGLARRAAAARDRAVRQAHPADAVPAGLRGRRRRSSSALPAAAGLELLHNFSLIHDDIEDNSPTRRHRPTAWSLWGVPAGHQCGRRHVQPGARGVLPSCSTTGVPERDCPGCPAALRRDEPGAHRGAVHGHDLRGPARRNGRRILCDDRGQDGRAARRRAGNRRVDRRGDAEKSPWCFREYGAALGRAFQLQDDILGIWGDEKQTGKSAASDILTKKKSLPVVLALNRPQGGQAAADAVRRAGFTPEHVPAVLCTARPGRRPRSHGAGSPGSHRPRPCRAPGDRSGAAATGAASRRLLASCWTCWWAGKADVSRFRSDRISTGRGPDCHEPAFRVDLSSPRHFPIRHRKRIRPPARRARPTAPRRRSKAAPLRPRSRR